MTLMERPSSLDSGTRIEFPRAGRHHSTSPISGPLIPSSFLGTVNMAMSPYSDCA